MNKKIAMNIDFDKLRKDLSDDRYAASFAGILEMILEAREIESLSDEEVCFLIACAGGTGNGAIECLNNLERTTRHMGMASCDRLPVVRFSRDYMLPAIEKAGVTFGSLMNTKC